MPVTIELPSTIEGVTVHRSDALVRRVADAGLLSMPAVLRIGPLPLAVQPASVRAVVLDPAGSLAPQAATARVAVEPIGAMATPEDQAPAQRALEAAQRALDEATNEVDRLTDDITALTTKLEPSARKRALTGEATLVERDREPVPVENRLALVSFRAQQLDLLTPALVAAHRVQRDAARAYDEARDRLMASNHAEGREHELVAVVYVALQGAGTTEPGTRLELSYLAAGATWRPSHRLFVDGPRSRLALGAVVTQRTGEDWSGVTLALATTEPALRWQLPELKPLRIGRAAPRSATGWRAPEPLPAELFADFDRAQRVAADELSLERDLTDPAVFDGALGAPTDGPSEAAPMAPMAPMSAPALAAPAATMAPQALAASDRNAPKGARLRSRLSAPAAAPASAPPPTRGGGIDATMALAALAPPPELDPDRPDPSVADLDLLVLPAPTADDRGRPRPRRAGQDATSHTARARALVHQQLAADGYPPADPVAATRAGLACAYRAAAAVDIASARTVSTILITEETTEVREEFVTVPYEAADVFRTLVFANPLTVPVVAGPIEVSGPGGYVGPAELPTLTPGAEARVGVGIEDGIRVERQVDHRDDAKGLVRSTRVLEHHVSIRLTNRLATRATIIVRERVPTVPETEDRAAVEELTVEPAWRTYKRDDAILHGGREWSVTVEPSQTAALQARWQIVIPAKFEIEGGNRR